MKYRIIHFVELLIFPLFLSFFFSVTSIYANGILSGVVMDSKTHQPLSAVNIQVLGTLLGGSTEKNGNFIIDKIPAGIYTIRASMMGYRSETITGVKIDLSTKTELKIQLVETAIQFDPIIISANKTQQRLDLAPVSLSVINSKEIESRNPTNLIEVLETAPGVMFIGNQINIRGSTGYTFGAGNKVLLLLDGIPVYASDTGEFNWDMIPPSDIEQVEILKGAGSTLWGASALGGVVNIITKTPSPQEKWHVNLSTGKYDKPYYKEWYWTDHTRLFYDRQDMSYSKQFASVGFRCSASRFVSKGYRQLGDFEKYNVTGRFDYRVTSNLKFIGYAAYSYSDQGFFVQWKGQNDPYEVDEANLQNYAQLNQFNLYAKITRLFSSRFSVSVRASMVRTLMGNQFGDGNEFNPALGQGIELQADWIPAVAHSLTFGVQYQHDAGSTKFFGDHQGYFIGPYVQDEWRLNKTMRLTMGVRYDRYQLIENLKEDLISPRIGINWQPWQITSFRASAGSGFRAATIVERFLELSIMNFNIVSNPQLKAETSWAFDVGCRHYFTSNWNIDVSLFDNEYQNLIEAHMDLIRGQIQFRNVPRARIQGVEVTTNFTAPFFVRSVNMNSHVQLSLTAMNHQDLEWNEPLTYRPKTLATIRYTQHINQFQLHVDYRYASKIDEVKIYPINDRVPMKFVDVRLSYNYRSLTMQLGINNLLQYNYAPMESNLLPMRTFTLGLNGEF